MADIVDLNLWRELRRYRRLEVQKSLFPELPKMGHSERAPMWNAAGGDEAEWRKFCTDGWKNGDLP